MSSDTKISLSVLSTAFQVIVDHLAAVEGSSITLDLDYFWSVPPDALHDVYNSPPDLTVGQVSEAWSHLERIAAGEVPPVAYALVWLADVLRAAGTQVVR